MRNNVSWFSALRCNKKKLRSRNCFANPGVFLGSASDDHGRKTIAKSKSPVFAQDHAPRSPPFAQISKVNYTQSMYFSKVMKL